MDSEWIHQETDNYSDHVIEHVKGTTVLGYFLAEEAIHLLLDIGFILTIYADAQMALTIQSLCISELTLEDYVKAELLNDIQLLHDEGRAAEGLAWITPAPADCLITDVSIYALDERRRIMLTGEDESILVETSPGEGDINVESLKFAADTM
ncbi:MAG TPA: hypothetical protein VK619_05055 [Pyrinomonadaceae bacterium]|nr:hypothetical protein [Pyrinomonadaceae bacterium]